MSAGKQARVVDLYVAPPKASATVHDLRAQLEKSRHRSRARELDHENALLARLVSETQSEIVRLRRLLAKS
jgi:hypothetical protein